MCWHTAHNFARYRVEININQEKNTLPCAVKKSRLLSPEEKEKHIAHSPHLCQWEGAAFKEKPTDRFFHGFVARMKF